MTPTVTIEPARQFSVDAMDVRCHVDEGAMAAGAATHAALVIGRAIEERGVANVMFASGNSQLEFLAHLRRRDDVDWPCVVGFHMDEYLGMDATHPASFRRYMHEQIIDRVRVGAFHELEGDAGDPADECRRYASLLREHPLDLCCLGIGENGHLAFNDPPVADFDDPLDVKVVELDDACRAQQVGEGHFAAFDDVPARALTVTIPALLRASVVLVIAPEARKHDVVHEALAGPVSTSCPASVLRTLAHVTLYLDDESGRGLAAL